MKKEDIIRKLTSRKFWAAVAAFVAGIMTAFKADAETTESVTGLIMAGAAVIAYIIGEGMTDVAGTDREPVNVVLPHIVQTTETSVTEAASGFIETVEDVN